jgi:hypothetical protein
VKKTIVGYLIREGKERGQGSYLAADWINRFDRTLPAWVEVTRFDWFIARKSAGVIRTRHVADELARQLDGRVVPLVRGYKADAVDLQKKIDTLTRAATNAIEVFTEIRVHPTCLTAVRKARAGLRRALKQKGLNS